MNEVPAAGARSPSADEDFKRELVVLIPHLRMRRPSINQPAAKYADGVSGFTRLSRYRSHAAVGAD